MFLRQDRRQAHAVVEDRQCGPQVLGGDPKPFRECRSDTFVIMPNHLHGIVIVKTRNGPRRDIEALIIRTLIVETLHAMSLRRPQTLVRTVTEIGDGRAIREVDRPTRTGIAGRDRAIV